MRSLLLFPLLLSIAYIQAQDFIEVAGTPFEGVLQSRIAFADVNGDHAPDVLIAGRNNNGDYIADLYTNNGTGAYTRFEGQPFEGYDLSSFAFADIDGDQDQDLLLTGRSALPTQAYIAALYTNDGTGQFTEVSNTPFEAVDNSSIAFTDIDGDQDQDLLLTGIGYSQELIAQLYKNDGSGIFTEFNSSALEGITLGTLAFADVDGDQDQDLLLTGRSSTAIYISRLYTNDGSGIFTEMQGTPFEPIITGSLAFSDIDGDMDIDVLITGKSYSGPNVALLYQNDGTGNFTEITDTPFEGVESSSIAFADVDGDADQDVVIAGRTNINAYYTILHQNDGQGNYSEGQRYLFEGVETGALAFADVDRDGDPDLLLTGRNNSGDAVAKLYRNDFATSTSVQESDVSFRLSPNPISTGSLNLHYHAEQSARLSISIHDLQGNVVWQRWTRLSSGVHTIRMDVESLIPGQYVVLVNNDKSRGKSQFIKL